MQLVINLPFQKYLINTIFMVLMIKVIYNIAMMITGDSFSTVDATLITVGHIIDVVMWCMIAVWFLHLHLYDKDVVSHRVINVVSALCVGAVMLKALSSVFFVLYFITPAKWTMAFSAFEVIVWIVMFIYLIGIWTNAIKSSIAK